LLDRLAEAKRTAAPLAWSRVAGAFSDEPPEMITFGAPDGEGLYAQALRYEQTTGRAFSRELAAVWTVADGIHVDDLWWYLEPAREWTWEDHGLRIGCGSSMQGSLYIEGAAATVDLARARVVDRDDDGVELHRYESLAALLRLLLD